MGSQRSGVERGKRREFIIRDKVRFNFQQLVERNLGPFAPIKKRQRRRQYRVRPKRSCRMSDSAPRVFHRRFVILQ